MTLTFDGNDYSIPPQGLLVDNLLGYSCGIPVTSTNEDFYILGVPFMRNFYVELNYANETISLAETAQVPTLADFSLWEIIAICFAVIVGYVGIIVGLYIWRNRKYKRIRDEPLL